MEIDLEYEMLNTPCDDAALWNHWLNLEIIQAARAGAAWYRGETGAKLPEKLLSAVTNPHDDGDKAGAHRMLALGRKIDQFQDLEREVFRRFEASCYRTVAELACVANLAALGAAKTWLDDFFAYLRRKRRDEVPDARFRAVVDRKIEGFIGICRKISSGFAKLERELMGMGAADGDLRRIEGKVDVVRQTVRRIERGGRPLPAGAKARKWVMAMVAHYRANPHELCQDVRGRKPPIMAIWDTVQKTARENYGIVDGRHFRRIYDSGQKAARRTEPGNEPINEPLNEPINANEPLSEPLNEPINANEPLSEPINEPLKVALMKIISDEPGQNRKQLASRIGKRFGTVKRVLARLVKTGKIEHRGSKKTGGYHLHA